ncbi:diaminopropionate ammonia-lyase [Denitrobaculum tricleocarpae]|uniref:Diaminopropionate ammonia-lyase n=1 Tax=Denitrobaculum tricleocarpae TaxID=2591009 RepID=A0A545TT24_9PROT|nr:diaminopropionate ammonia-lyase [Denitrobaculum tricleocarpae]TQV80370.1 diaminopropionate ammonia-lyase [Denitrobaculum tricleocarpae]
MLHHTHTPLRATTPRLFRTTAGRPLAMLRNCPAYEATPLHRLEPLAGKLEVAILWAKDETQRMGLGSFKALGGAFAVAQMISDVAATSDLTSQQARNAAADMTFITASAGNHGLSVAAGARVFGARAVIVFSTSVPESFAERIRTLNAEVVRVDGSYEDSVAEATRLAETENWLLLADGSWEGYIERPAMVMEGYTVLAEECRADFAMARLWPTHVFLQAGVGGLAAAVAAHIREFWDEQPHIIVVEPDAAPCLMASVKAGGLTRAEGPLSNMGRLDCKDASLIAYDSLRRDAQSFVTVSDEEAAEAVALYARNGITTTPSGAATLAALQLIAPGPDSRCLLIVSEGGT